MGLDNKSLVLLTVFVALALTCLAVLVWRSRRRYPGFRRWIIGIVLLAIALALVTERGNWPDWLTVIVACGCALAAGAVVLEGTLAFLEHPSCLSQTLPICAAAVACIAFFEYVRPNPKARVLVMSAALAAIAMIKGFVLARHVPVRPSIGLRFTAIVFFIDAAVHLARGGYLVGHSQNASVETIFVFAITVLMIGGSFGLILMTHERLEADLQISQEKIARANRDLEEAMAQVELHAQKAIRADAAKTSFLANMSHEIRTPMNGVLGMTELALETQLTEEQRDMLNTVYSSASSLLGIINDVLDYSKIEAGRLELVCSDFHLRESLEDAVRMFALNAQQKGIELVLDAAPEVPKIVHADPVRLRQVIVNLLGNAVKFTSEGEIVLGVETVESDAHSALLRFAVRDTGIGVPPEKQQLIFDAFSQADGSTSRRYGGTGLGLTICSRLVELMGSRIGIESVPDGGSTFHFTIRVAVTQGAARPLAQAARMLRGLRTLIVDDNRASRVSIQRILESWEMKPAVASSAAQGWELFESTMDRGEPFELVLIDANMPGLNGRQFIERMRKSPELARVPVVLMTVSSEPQALASSSRVVRVTKPVRQADLQNGIESALRSARVAPSGDPAALRVLLAEDNPINQFVASRLLEKLGHSVSVVANGREALSALDREPFDLVLMDVQMPEMDGFEATALLRERETRSGTRTPVVAMTAHASRGDEERCLAAGMDAYLAKPIEIDSMSRLLEDCAERTELSGRKRRSGER